MTTPVEVWAPAFERARILPERLTPDAIFGAGEDRRFPGSRWCKLCETYVPFAERKAHANEHQRERTEWRRQGRRTREKEGTDRALGDEVPDPASSSSGRPSNPTGREVKRMTTSEKKGISGRQATIAAFRAAEKPLTANEAAAIVIDSGVEVEAKGKTPMDYRLFAPIYREAKRGRLYKRVGSDSPAKFVLRADAPESDPTLIETLKARIAVAAGKGNGGAKTAPKKTTGRKARQTKASSRKATPDPKKKTAAAAKS